jgi:hypothetical protein
MKLREKQSAFVGFVALLILRAHQLGYQLTFGDVRRSVEEAKRLGKVNSVHTLSLAVDFNLFRNGEYLDKTEDHKVLGEYWESLHPLCRWGGRFGDGNHYSFEHNGVK